ncbi:MAG: hypothetical protein J5I93_01230 [Pirellulaceae bacterium]|nr:hypothetical protein [Pirellulaceae bacterium]
MDERPSPDAAAGQCLSAEQLLALGAGKLPVADACEIIRQAAVWLDTLHGQGQLYREVKPANLLLARDGSVTLRDLGPSSGVELTAAAEQPPASDDLVLAGSDLPRLPGGWERPDIYSLGCTLLKLLTGRTQFDERQGRLASDRGLAPTQGASLLTDELRENAPQELADILERMLATDPGQRFAAAREVAQALVPLAASADLPRLFESVQRSPADASPNDVGATASSETIWPARNKMPPLPEVVVPPTRDPVPTALIVAGFAAVGMLLLCGGAGLVTYWSLARPAKVWVQSSPAPVFTNPRDLDIETAPVASNASAAPEIAEEPLPEAGPAIDLLALVDLQRDSVAGLWQRDEQGLVSVPTGVAILQLPYVPPDEYQIRATVEQLDGQDGPNFGVLVGDRRCRLAIDNYAHLGYLSGPTMVDSRSLDQHQDLARRGKMLPLQKLVEIVCTVRKLGDDAVLRAAVDGQEIIAWRGSASRLSVAEDRSGPARVPFLMCWRTKLRFSRLELVPLGQTGRAVEFIGPDQHADLAAAQRILWKGGQVQIELIGETHELLKYEQFEDLVRRQVAAESGEAGSGLGLAVGFRVTAIDNLRSPWFHPGDLAWCSKLSALQRLTWANMDVSPADLASLTDAPRLAELHLDWCRSVGDEHLAAIGKLTHLESLDLAYSSVTDAGLSQLAALERLHTLRLDHSSVTDAAGQTLKQLPMLRRLSLNGTAVSNAAAWSEVSQVKHWQVIDSGFSSESVDALRRQLPDAQVVGGWDPAIDLLPLAELHMPDTKARWWRADDGIWCEQAAGALAAIPLTPPHEYDLELVAERQSGNDGFGLLLVGGGRPFVVEWDHQPHAGPFTLIDMIDGRRGQANESAVQGASFPIGVPVRVAVQVRRDRVRVLREGQDLIDWPADYSRLQVAQAWQTAQPRIVGIVAWRGAFAVRELTLRPLSGPVVSARLWPTERTSDRELAVWALQHGGTVQATFDGQQALEFSSADELPAGPLWLRRIQNVSQAPIDEPVLQRIASASQLVRLDLDDSPLADDQLRYLSGLRDLEELSLNGTQVTDAGLAHLAGLPLRVLKLGRTQVDGTGFDALNARTLRFIQLGTTKVATEGWVRLARFESLTYLDVAGAKIGDSDLALLEKMPGLTFLHLGWTRVEGPGLAHVARLPNLQRLILMKSLVDDRAMAHLAGMRQLRMLNLQATAVGDQELSQLGQLSQLQELILTDTQVSEPAARQLREQLPQTRIQLGDLVLE